MFSKDEFEVTEENRCCDWHFHELILGFKREGVTPAELKNLPLATHRSKLEVGKIGDISLVCANDVPHRRFVYL